MTAGLLQMYLGEALKNTAARSSITFMEEILSGLKVDQLDALMKMVQRVRDKKEPPIVVTAEKTK